jgi:hypothetical protein
MPLRFVGGLETDTVPCREDGPIALPGIAPWRTAGPRPSLRLCVVCEGLFKPYRPVQLTCSPACGRKRGANMKRLRMQPHRKIPLVRNCKVCDVTFESASLRLACSPACRKEMDRRIHRAQNQKPATQEYFRQWKRTNREKLSRQARARRAANPEKHREQDRNQRAANPDRYKAYRLKSYYKHQEKRLAANRKWHAEHPEYWKKKRDKNPEKRAAYSSKWYWKNDQRARQKAREWNAENPEYASTKHSRTRAAHQALKELGIEASTPALAYQALKELGKELGIQLVQQEKADDKAKIDKE